MYSVVLLMALSGSADAPALGFGKSCHGCSGCDGGSYSCDGGSCDGCHGCCGGKKMFGGGGLFGHKGCCGGDGCCGGKHHGCCGGGGFFKKHHKSCHGCSGCNGCNGCSGCAGWEGGHGVSMPHADMSVPAPVSAPTTVSAAATIVINLPADAKLLIDGNATTSTTDRRVFVSPTLEAGQEYYYTVKAEYKGQVREERVSVTAGQEVNLKLEFPDAVASK